FVTTDDRLAATEVDNHVAILDALDGAVDDLANAVAVLVELTIALGFTHLLDDDLLGRLRRDATEIHRRKLLGDEVTDLRIRIAGTRIDDRDFASIFFDVLDNFEQALQLHLAGRRVDVGAYIGFLTVARAR